MLAEHYTRFKSVSQPFHSKQATMHTAIFLPQCRFSPRSAKGTFPPDWVSTKFGSGAICRYGSPKNLNFQHQPRFGQPKPAPETSQICPSALLTPSNSLITD